MKSTEKSKYLMAIETTHSIIIANDLLTGRSVYFTSKSGWTETPEQAELIEAGPNAEARLQAALEGEKNNLVIDPYLVSVGADRQVRDTREHIRTTGPTIFAGAQVAARQVTDGKFAAARGVHAVSNKSASASAA